MVGATSTSRAARGTTPRFATPRPAITHGARACTTPSDPCSPRWPPWSSQLCRERVQHAQVGSGGSVEELDDLLVHVRDRCCRSGAGACGRARRRGPRRRRWPGSPIGFAPSSSSSGHDARFGREADPTVGAQRLVGAVAAGEHHVDDRFEARVEEHVEGGLGQSPVLVGDLVGRSSSDGPEATSVMTSR